MQCLFLQRAAVSRFFVVSVSKRSEAQAACGRNGRECGRQRCNHYFQRNLNNLVL